MVSNNMVTVNVKYFLGSINSSKENVEKISACSAVKKQTMCIKAPARVDTLTLSLALGHTSTFSTLPSSSTAVGQNEVGMG